MISIRKGNLTTEKADVIILNTFAGAKELGGATAAVDTALGGMINRILQEEKFGGKLGEVKLIRTEGRLSSKRILVVGLGEQKAFNEESVRCASAAALDAAKAIGAKKIATVFHGTGNGNMNAKVAAKAIVEGARLADYSFGRYRKESQAKSPSELVIVTTDGKIIRAGQDGIRLGEICVQGTISARELVNTPGQHMSPHDLVEAARSLTKGKSGVRMKVYDKERLVRMKAGGLLGIAQGSDHPPYLVHLTYTPKKKTRKSVALVGKAVTFDSGGLSLKPAEAMATMKLDMAGAAAVIGVFAIIDQIAPNATVHGIFGAVENMPSGKAIRPGDVVEVMNGKTIEILNTDAEGRVTLADTLTYATKQKPDAIIDLATLTGACMVALGEEITGIMGNDRALIGAVEDAAQTAGEKVWELPLEPAYKPLIKSDVADYKNIAGKYGGAVTAGLLLEEFVAGIPWVHMDIAGPSFAERPMNAYTKKGATGHGVRTLIEFLRNL